MPKKILVTGGTGYIGSHTIVDLIENGYDVVSVDNGINSDVGTLDKIKQITGKSIVHYVYDLCDALATNSLFSEHSFDGIIHFAALKSVGDSVANPLLYFRNNINSLINVLQAAKNFNVRNFIFSSSCTVYGNAKEMQVDENTPWQEAASPYGRTKQIGENIITDSFKGSDHKAILLRYFNPAGAHKSALLGEAPSQVAQNLIPVITETAYGIREQFQVFGNDYDTRDGSCIRDFIHVMDLAKAHTLSMNYLLDAKQALSTDVYNLGMGEGVSVLEAIHAFEKVTGIKPKYQLAARRPGDVVAIYSNYKKINKAMSWIPQYDIDDIMSTAWEWEKVRRK